MMNEWRPITRLRSTGSGLGAVLESYHKLQPKPKVFPEFKDALQIWYALPKKAIDIWQPC